MTTPDNTSAPAPVRAWLPVMLALAAIWDEWRGALRTCAIVTTAAVEPVSALHERMPLVIAPDVWDAWLDPGHSGAELERSGHQRSRVFQSEDIVVTCSTPIGEATSTPSDSSSSSSIRTSPESTRTREPFIATPADPSKLRWCRAPPGSATAHQRCGIGPTRASPSPTQRRSEEIAIQALPRAVAQNSCIRHRRRTKAKASPGGARLGETPQGHRSGSCKP